MNCFGFIPRSLFFSMPCARKICLPVVRANQSTGVCAMSLSRPSFERIKTATSLFGLFDSTCASSVVEELCDIYYHLLATIIHVEEAPFPQCCPFRTILDHSFGCPSHYLDNLKKSVICVAFDPSLERLRFPTVLTLTMLFTFIAEDPETPYWLVFLRS
jgi:hypothetical protein